MSAIITGREALTEVRKYFEQLPEIAEHAAVLAINETVSREGMTMIKRDMRDQINFPAGYLETRLQVSRKAGRGALSAAIRGRDRATSLARFAAGQTPDNTRGRGVRVSVKKGRTEHLQRAFLVRLRNGNIGLAVRLKDGESIRNTTRAVELQKNVYLLYGPSVDQVFKDVAVDNYDDLLGMVTNKFLRQFARLSRG